MNLHPLVVHFPIAFLSLYSGMEVLRFRFFTRLHVWSSAKIGCLFLGVLGAFVALSTGESAEHLLQNIDLRSSVELHSLVATVTTYLYAFLAVCYFIVVLSESTVQWPTFLRKVLAALQQPARVICRPPLVPLLATVGFVGLSVTGGLGALLVYGPTIDPFVQFLQTFVR